MRGVDQTLAVGPFSPWRQLKPGETPSAKKGIFSESAPVYRALALLGISAVEVDRMEIWQLASMLGVDEQESRGAPQQTADDLVRERWQRHKAGLPPPEPRPTG